MARKVSKTRTVRKNCFFCQEGKEPDYKEPSTLRGYMSERGRILARARTGVCAKHQRRLDQQIKRARFLGYLPFVVTV